MEVMCTRTIHEEHHAGYDVLVAVVGCVAATHGVVGVGVAAVVAVVSVAACALHVRVVTCIIIIM